MPFTRALPPEIEQALARNWVVLTANQRAARTLRHAFDLRQRALDRTIWEPPPILAWDTWTNSLWNRLLLDGHASDLLLSPAQEHTLWHAIIAADAATASLRPVDALAQTAADAWKLLHDYRGRQRLQSFPGNSDTRAFARWVREFELRCVRSQYLTEAQLAETLRAAVAAGHLTFAEGFLLVGFDTKTPAQIALLDAVRSTGAHIDSLEPAPLAPELALASAPDEHAELAACARWLRARLTQQPDAAIAVIVPDTEPARAEIDRVFRSVLAPELNDIVAPAASGPYEFSLGVPLARTPLVATALDILRWANGPLPLDRVSNLLLSPHFAANPTDASSERIARAEFDAFVLRRQHLLEPQLSLDRLLNLASHPKHSANLPTLLDHLRTLRPLITHRELSGERTHADWAAAIHELLEAAGWAPLPQLDSTEFQTRSKWDDALDELATLDFDSAFDGTRVSFADALAALERIAAETLFAPESRHAPIQIMGPLESAGSTFDAIWFLRANDVDWPATLAPNPLLPWLLQRELDMPGANPILHSDQARHTTERIAESAPTAVFSYAQQSADGPQRSSPILAHLALEPRRAADIVPAAPAPAPIALDDFADDAPIPPPPDRVHQGGAGILEAQAACGFRAFAQKRLFAAALDSTSLGLDARERGSLVHAVLQHFWAEVKTQAALIAMPLAERDAQLTRSIDAALAEDRLRPEPGWPRAYIDTERRRLLKLLGRWLDYEAAERLPFAVKSLEETKNDVLIGPLRLAIRVDRIDINLNSDEPAGDIILDYKTGPANPADWLGPRPDAPQLPLYAVVSHTPHLAGVAFASVRPGKYLELTGYQAHDGILPKPVKLKTETLEAQVAEWHDVLTALAEDFNSGKASVSPKQYPQTCQYCDQRLLCRLNPFKLDADVLEDFDFDSQSDLADPTAEADFG
ncbi:MAG: PD-(D/E)XK nuclease family protein [Acidobacteriaceae bacterium]|jgi:probable DNA repair protein